jgi:hypothetical protein
VRQSRNLEVISNRELQTFVARKDASNRDHLVEFSERFLKIRNKEIRNNNKKLLKTKLKIGFDNCQKL